MSYDDLREEIPGGVVKGAAGFFGMVAAVFLLPRVLRFGVKNYFFRALAEIIAIVTVGLLTEKVVSWISRYEEPARPEQPKRVTPKAVSEPVL